MDAETKNSGKLSFQDFKPDQMEEIKAGLAAGINVSEYARPEFTSIQMRQIRLGLEGGLDVSLYADPQYDWLQMIEIRRGLESKVNVASYASFEIPHDKMRGLREGLEQNINLLPYLEMDAGVIREILKAKIAGFEIAPYVEAGYDCGQLEQIRMSRLHSEDIAPFLRLEYRAAALEEIRHGLEVGVDVSIYAKDCYTWLQMREIRLGLMKRLNVALYQNPLYSHKQMQEIRLGLESGIPVDSYLPLRYSATDMREMRLKLQGSMDSVERNLRAADTNIKEILAEVAEQEEDPFRIVVTPDEMEVYLMFRGKERDFTEEDVLSALWNSRIRKGILRREITKAVNGTYKERSVLVACGQAPRSGKDGYYEFFFNTDIRRKPKVLEDGSVDYQDVEWFEMVHEGDKLAYYHVAEAGSNGYNIRGDVLPAMKGKEQNVLKGSGFKLLQDKCTYVALSDGYAELHEDKLTVNDMLVVQEVSLATGNVVFNGSVHVKGNVYAGAVIRAGGDVLVDGFVEGAVIESGGDVLLKLGVNASGRGYITAGKDVKSKFLESVNVAAKGSIQFNYCLNCNLTAGDTIVAEGTKSSLVGGVASSVKGIVLQNAGNPAGAKTLLQTGVTGQLRREYKRVQEQIRKNSEELAILENAKAEMEQQYPPEVYNTLEIYGKLEKAISTEKQQRDELFAEKEAMDEELEIADTAQIVVRGRLYEGVEVELHGKRWSTGYTMNVTIRKTQDDMIAAYRN